MLSILDIYLTLSLDWLTLIALLSVVIVLVFGLNLCGSESVSCKVTVVLVPSFKVTVKSLLSASTNWFSLLSLLSLVWTISVSSSSSNINLVTPLVYTGNAS